MITQSYEIQNQNLSPTFDFYQLNMCYVNKFSILPSSSSHDTTSILCSRLTAACTVMVHTEVVAHLVGHGGGHANSVI